MSLSSPSRSSSFFSLDSYASSFTSNPPSPLSTFDEKRAPQQIEPTASSPLVLRWKPQFFSSAFTHHTSTHIKFSAFPPCDYKSHLSGFDFLSWRTAISLLHDDRNPACLSSFASSDSSITPVTEIPIPANLPAELVEVLQNGAEWQLYAISEPVPVSVSISSVTAFYKHYVAFKKLQNGVERYMFGPASLCIYSVCRLVDVGRPHDGSVPPETLCLEEHVEVLCNKTVKWLYKSAILKRISESHENLRLRWDQTMVREWATLQKMREIDLLA